MLATNYIVFVSQDPYPNRSRRQKTLECNTRPEAFAELRRLKEHFDGFNFCQIISIPTRTCSEFIRGDNVDGWVINESMNAHEDDLPELPPPKHYWPMEDMATAGVKSAYRRAGLTYVPRPVKAP